MFARVSEGRYKLMEFIIALWRLVGAMLDDIHGTKSSSFSVV